MSKKRRTDTLPRHIQQIVREQREQQARALGVPKPSIQSPEDVIRSMSTEEVEQLQRLTKQELAMRGRLSMPDLSVILREWRERNKL